MDITFSTEFKLGDEVWFMDSNRIVKGKVEHIAMGVCEDMQSAIKGVVVKTINYVVDGKLMGEEDLFHEPKELLFSLQMDYENRYGITRN